MLMDIIKFIPSFIMTLLSAYISYLLDQKYDYVRKINSKLGLNKMTSIMFYIGIMSLLMFAVIYVLMLNLHISKEITKGIVSFIIGICIYSAMDYKKITS